MDRSDMRTRKKTSAATGSPLGKIEGRIKVTWGWGRRRKQLLHNLKEKRWCWKLEEEALDRTVWRTRFGRGTEPVVRQTAVWMNVVKFGVLFLHLMLFGMFEFRANRRRDCLLFLGGRGGESKWNWIYACLVKLCDSLKLESALVWRVYVVWL